MNIIALFVLMHFKVDKGPTKNGRRVGFAPQTPPTPIFRSEDLFLGIFSEPVS